MIKRLFKVVSMMIVSYIAIAIVASCDTSELNNELLEYEPTSEVLSTYEPTVIPTSTKTSIEVECDWIGTYPVEVRDLSVDGAKRLDLIIQFGEGCDENDAMDMAIGATYARLTQTNDIDAISYRFFCDLDWLSSVNINFAYHGEWSYTGETPDGDYSQHEFVYEYIGYDDLPCGQDEYWKILDKDVNVDAQYYKNKCGVGKRGWVTIALARQCGFTMPVCKSSNPALYDAMHDGDSDGCVGE